MSSGSSVRGRARALGALVALVALAGCPGPADPTRDGGTPCASESDCNPPGVSCGAVQLCLRDPGATRGVCSATSEVRACPDGASYPDSSIMEGDCLEYQDCNPEENVCGLLIACTNFHCDATPSLMIPCGDDASVPPDASGVDAALDGAITTDF